MKKYCLAALATFLLIVVSAPQAIATPTTITDTYIGADPTHNYAHVDSIGGNDFNITRMVVDFTASSMLVDIYATNYFSKNLPFENTVMGDLFISTNGMNTPYPSGGSANDTMSTGEQWEYVAVLDSHTATSGRISVYSVNSNQILASTLNGLDPSRWIYRANQEWAYDPQNQTAVSSGTWNRDTTNSVLSLSLIMPTEWNQVTEYGFHWGMSCGNDVIEGKAEAPVPEPATMLLFGSGLLGSGIIFRKRGRKV